MGVWTSGLLALGLLAGLPASTGMAASPYDCSLAASAAEIAICDSPELDALDRDASHAYDHARAALLEEGKLDAMESLRAAQFGFLQARDGCGFDVPCLTAVYKARLKALGN